VKLGFITSILEPFGYEEMMDFAAAEGFTCVEVACWPAGKGERRYAGTSHIDAERVLEDASYPEHILEYSKKTGVEISALAYYPNPLDGDEEKRAANIRHLKAVIAASARLKVFLVTTFIGRDQRKNLEENLELVKEVWPPILEYAKSLGVRIAIENCPMLFGPDQWPGGQNLMVSPAVWRRVFEVLPYDNLGINYDPSHFVWQMMDYIKPLYEFKDRIFHVHYKDIKLFREKLDETGVMAYPLDFMAPKIPGLGDVDWGKYISALTDIGYRGCACVEVEDRAFEGCEEDILNSLRQSRKYLSQFLM
jgi:sugar phosphate isomerase/epimerase